MNIGFHKYSWISLSSWKGIAKIYFTFALKNSSQTIIGHNLLPLSWTAERLWSVSLQKMIRLSNWSILMDTEATISQSTHIFHYMCDMMSNQKALADVLGASNYSLNRSTFFEISNEYSSISVIFKCFTSEHYRLWLNCSCFQWIFRIRQLYAAQPWCPSAVQYFRFSRSHIGFLLILVGLNGLHFLLWHYTRDSCHSVPSVLRIVQRTKFQVLLPQSAFCYFTLETSENNKKFIFLSVALTMIAQLSFNWIDG